MFGVVVVSSVVAVVSLTLLFTAIVLFLIVKLSVAHVAVICVRAHCDLLFCFPHHREFVFGAVVACWGIIDAHDVVCRVDNISF